MQNRDDHQARYSQGMGGGSPQGARRQPPRPPASPGQRPPVRKAAYGPAGGQRRGTGAAPQGRAGNRAAQNGRRAEPDPGNKRKRSRVREPIGASRWTRAVIGVLATIGLCLFLAIFILNSATDLFGLNKESLQIEVAIPQDPTIGEVAKILGESGVVRQSSTFRFYAGLKSEDADFKSGNYILNSNMGYDEIIVALKSGSQKEEVQITFIEGWTLSEIAAALEEEGVCDGQAFIDYLNSAEFNSEFINAIPDSSLRYHRLEGYMFPDTYYFFKGQDVDEVARKVLNNFNDKITDSMRARMAEMNMTLDETVILASIIQREAGQMDDMKLVSGVLHNRLKDPQEYSKLQSDVTMLYVNDEIKPYLNQTNQAMYDAYNTYEAQGLPAGPICNPGENALMAALYPADTEYYYFVTDSEGEFYYAASASEHYANVVKAARVGTGETHGLDTQ